MATKTNANDEGYQRRLDLVHHVLRSHNLEWSAVETVEYYENVPFDFNNFIYKISLSSPAMPSAFERNSPQPGTTLPPPGGVSTLIMRISNMRAEGLNKEGRVDNEVAVLHLVREHFATSHPDLVNLIPAVYAWSSASDAKADQPLERNFGWTLGEFMSGANLDAQFAEMDMSAKGQVVQQVANIFAALQSTPLPPALLATGHLGGLRFDAESIVVAGEMSMLPAGPWTEYAELWVAKMRTMLVDADKSSVVQGWQARGVRERIDSFLNGGLAHLLEGVDTTARALVHGDFTMNNLLFDSNTQRITAVLDFDWACVTHPVHEFMSGFGDLGGSTHPEDKNLQNAVLTGDFSLSSDSVSEEDQQTWKIAKALDAALAARGVIRPSEIKGIEKFERLRHFEETICPFRLGSAVMIARNTAEANEEAREKAEAALVAELEALGV